MKKILLFIILLFLGFSYGYSQYVPIQIVTEYDDPFLRHLPLNQMVYCKDSDAVYMLDIPAFPISKLSTTANHRVIGFTLDTTGFVMWTDTLVLIATKHDVDALSSSIYDSLTNHYDLIHGLDTGKVSTSGDVMYGDLNVNADVHADTVHATVKQSVYLNSLASWDSQGVLNDTIIPKNVSDTLYNKILAIRPNKPDTSFANINLIANTTLFPKGTYFHIYKGSYTATVNIARDSCVQYYDAGAIVTKTTSGAMFNCNGFTNPIRILGMGNFIKTTNFGAIFNSNVLSVEGTIEFDNMISTSGQCFYIRTYVNGFFSIKGNYCASSADYAIYFADDVGTAKMDINIKKIISTANYAFYSFYNTSLKITSEYISGVNYGVYLVEGYGAYVQDFDILFCSGYYISTTLKLNIKGVCNGLTAVGGTINGGSDFTVRGQLTVSGGIVSCIRECSYFGVTTVTGGELNITSITTGRYPNDPSFYLWNVSGGKLRLNCDYVRDYGAYTNYGTINLSSTGTVIINGTLTDKTGIITQTGGTLIINGVIKNPNVGDNFSISKTGGTLILNGATLIKPNNYFEFINCPSSAQNIMVYSGGVTTNGTTGDLLSAKSRKDSVKVTAVATTTIVLNDGSGGAETFTETDVVTYNTVDLMAARMASLINASGTLAITATYVSGNTFNIESDVAGTNYTQSGLINLTNTQLRLNSFAITDLTGGTIIEDSDVTY